MKGINAVCFGWGTAGGRAVEGAETVRELASSKRPAAGRNHDGTKVSPCVNGFLDLLETIKQDFKYFTFI